MGKPVVELLKRYPATAGVVGVLLPILVQLYLVSREQKK
jgi:hypothetical protein